MIDRKHRFHGLHSLGFVMRKGQVQYAQGLSLKFVLNNKQKEHRVAVVVSRKVSKSAVVRNRIRRRIFETVRKLQTQINRPFDLVFFVRDVNLKAVSAKELNQRVQTLLVKAGVVSSDNRSATTDNHDIVLTKEKINHNVHDTDRPADL